MKTSVLLAKLLHDGPVQSGGLVCDFRAYPAVPYPKHWAATGLSNGAAQPILQLSSAFLRASSRTKEPANRSLMKEPQLGPIRTAERV